MVNDWNEKKRNATQSTRRKSERTSPRRSFTVTERGVYIRYLIRDLRLTLNEMNAFTCLLRAYLGASIRPFISSAPLPFSGWLPFLCGHRGVPIILSALPPPSLACGPYNLWFIARAKISWPLNGHTITISSDLIFIYFHDCDNKLIHFDIFYFCKQII